MYTNVKLLKHLLGSLARHEMRLAVLQGHLAALIAQRDSESSLKEAIEEISESVRAFDQLSRKAYWDAVVVDLDLPPDEFTDPATEPSPEFDAWLKKHDFHSPDGQA